MDPIFGSASFGIIIGGSYHNSSILLKKFELFYGNLITSQPSENCSVYIGDNTSYYSPSISDYTLFPTKDFGCSLCQSSSYLISNNSCGLSCPNGTILNRDTKTCEFITNSSNSTNNTNFSNFTNSSNLINSHFFLKLMICLVYVQSQNIP